MNRAPNVARSAHSRRVARAAFRALFWTLPLMLGAPAPQARAEEAIWTTLTAYAHSGGFPVASVYDPNGDRFVMLGGTGYEGVVNGLYQFTLAGAPTWSPLVAQGTGAPATGVEAAVYDPARKRALFLSPAADVWALTLTGVPKWSRLTTSGTPPVAGFTAVLDAAHDRVIAFGGSNVARTLDLATLTWQAIEAAGQLPPARTRHVAVFDAANQRLVVFGGDDGSLRSDTWELSLDGIPTWHLIATSGPQPPPTRDAAAVFDAAGQRMVVRVGLTNPQVNTTWALSLGATPQWSQLATTGLVPPAANMVRAVLDPVRQRMFLTSNSPNYAFRNFTYELSLQGPPVWSEVYAGGQAIFPYAPPFPEYARTGYDPVRRRYLAIELPVSGTDPRHGWILDLTGPPTLKMVRATGAPTNPNYRVMFFDPPRQRFVLVGGPQTYVATLGEAGFEWTTMAGVDPGPFYDHGTMAMTYDSNHERWLLFGGQSGVGVTRRYYGDAYQFSLSNLSFAMLAGAGSGPVSAGDYDAATYDAQHNRLIVFGSFTGNSGPYREAWGLALDGPRQWTRLGRPDPSAAYLSGVVYDSRRDRIMLWGDSGTSDFWVLPMGVPAAWTRLQTRDAPYFVGISNYDSLADRALAIPDLNTVRVLAFSGRAPSVQCPPDFIPVHMGINRVEYVVTNHDPLERSFDFDLVASRNWPGFPLNGLIERVPAFGSRSVPIGLPIADTVTALGALTMNVRLRGDPAVSASCEHVLGGVEASIVVTPPQAGFEPGRVRLSWHADRAVQEAAVYRREELLAWNRIGAAECAADGTIRFDDQSVSAGRRYAYRLGLGPAESEELTPEQWVSIPGFQFGLVGAAPNPSLGIMNVAFSLPSDDPARIDVFDLAGRRVASRDVGHLGPGSHVVEFSRSIGTGVFWVRLTQGTHSRTAKACLVQ